MFSYLKLKRQISELKEENLRLSEDKQALRFALSSQDEFCVQQKKRLEQVLLENRMMKKCCGQCAESVDDNFKAGGSC